MVPDVVNEAAMLNLTFPTDYREPGQSQTWQMISEMENMRTLENRQLKVRATVDRHVKAMAALTPSKIIEMIRAVIQQRSAHDKDLVKNFIHGFNNRGGDEGANAVGCVEFQANLEANFHIGITLPQSEAVMRRLGFDSDSPTVVLDLARALFPPANGLTWQAISEQQAKAELEKRANKYEAEAKHVYAKNTHGLVTADVLRIIRTKVMERTDSDRDRSKKIFSWFTATRDDGHDGIDADRFMAGLKQHLEIDLSRAQCADAFHALVQSGRGGSGGGWGGVASTGARNGSARLSALELFLALFPPADVSHSSGQTWQMLSEDEAARDLQTRRTRQDRLLKSKSGCLFALPTAAVLNVIRSKVHERTSTDSQRVKKVFDVFSACRDDLSEGQVSVREFKKQLDIHFQVRR